MILAIEVPPGTSTDLYRARVTAKTGKRYLIFDPTDPYTPLGELRGDLQDSYALLVPERAEELRKFLGTIGADEAAMLVLKRAL